MDKKDDKRRKILKTEGSRPSNGVKTTQERLKQSHVLFVQILQAQQKALIILQALH